MNILFINYSTNVKYTEIDKKNIQKTSKYMKYLYSLEMFIHYVLWILIFCSLDNIWKIQYCKRTTNVIINKTITFSIIRFLSSKLSNPFHSTSFNLKSNRYSSQFYWINRVGNNYWSILHLQQFWHSSTQLN